MDVATLFIDPNELNQDPMDGLLIRNKQISIHNIIKYKQLIYSETKSILYRVNGVPNLDTQRKGLY